MTDQLDPVTQMAQALKTYFLHNSEVRQFDHMVEMSGLEVEEARSALRVLTNKRWIVGWPDGATTYLTYVTDYVGP